MNERDLLQSAIRQSSGNVPQPSGGIVADAYESGKLGEPSTMLHVIAVLLARLSQDHEER